jgi:Uncharacterized protein conserved in bacteria (DUF2252)
MNFVKATRQFEKWLGKHTSLLEPDLRLKHQFMAEALFPFLRATFYRWVQLWPEVCPDLAKAPHLLAVGDLHVENFGTWRDIEGRLIWGVNDFDEAYTFAYTIDLVRLAASALLAAQDGHLPIKPKEICDTILEGYAESMRKRGSPFVLAENSKWLRLIAENELRDPVRFWEKMDKLPLARGEVPPSAREALEHLLPERGLSYRVAHRVAGLGSLGRMRFVALADWHGGRIAREAKAVVASSIYWARGDEGPAEILCQPIISRAVRCPDPFVQVRGRWIVRRLGPHCSRIELDTLRALGQELRLLHAMGWETANIHLGSPAARQSVLIHLKRQKARWLHNAAKAMLKRVTDDWQAWRKSAT